MRFAQENDEGFLTGVFGGGVVVQEASADAPHHGSMAPHQRLERGDSETRPATIPKLCFATGKNHEKP
jgi:hypothetical protein